MCHHYCETMKRIRISLILACASGFLVVVAQTAADGPHSSDASYWTEYIALVEELDARRRVNVLFPNPQSLFNGFQVGFVNVGTGNLTFLRRDMVVAANSGSPLVLGRVYDSRIEENADFGKGWKLSLAEELQFTNEGSLLYTDSSGARHKFVSRGSRFEPLVPVVELESATIEFLDDKAILRRERNARTLTFKQVSSRTSSYSLVRVELSHGKILGFDYAAGLLVGVNENGINLLRIKRDFDGRVTSVTDLHHRNVHYGYNADGLLTEVRDLAGDSWLHEYDLSGKLIGMVGGNGIRVMETAFGSDDRVLKVVAGRHFEFQYNDFETIVSDGTGRKHTFTQNDRGVTVAWSSTEGLGWHLSFDEYNRVRTLVSIDDRWSIHYNVDGSIAATENHAGRRNHYSYDELGRLTHRTSNDPAMSLEVTYQGENTRVRDVDGLIEFTTSFGKLASIKDEAGRIDVDRNRQGYVVGMRDGEQTVELERDPMHRIVATHYGNGFVSRYDYDALGNRDAAEHSLNSSVRYRHDSAGNIVSITVSNADGQVKNQSVEIGEMNQVNQVVYGDERYAMRVSYDSLGRPSRISWDRDTIDIAYIEGGTGMEMTSYATGQVWRGEVPRRHVTLNEDRSKLLHGLTSPRSQAGHATLAFNEATFKVDLIDPLALSVPNWLEAKASLTIGSALLRSDEFTAVTQFEKPSNPIFQALEYRSTNCCIPCSVNVCQECTIGSGYASWHLCFCESETLYYNYGPGSVKEDDDDNKQIDEIIEEYRKLKRYPIPSRSDFVKNFNTPNF